MNEQSIAILHCNKSGKISDKWESYLGYYDSVFGPLRHNSISMLEIGVQNGGSLETWSKYFASGKSFIGCDINPQCGLLKYDDPRISIVVGDANVASSLRAIRAISPELDIIIDDGSHKSDDILMSFINYFPMVKPGGLYVIEDTHTLYNDAFGGGILNEFSAYSFFKKLIDVINFQFWCDELSINTFFRTFFPLHSVPDFILNGWVDAVEFRNSIISIKKAKTSGHEKLGKRVVSGSLAQIQSFGGVVCN